MKYENGTQQFLLLIHILIYFFSIFPSPIRIGTSAASHGPNYKFLKHYEYIFTARARA